MPHANAVLRKARSRFRRQTPAHPVGRENSETDAVGDVVEGRNLMLHAVARPGTRRTADRKEAAAAKRTHHHELGAGFIVVGSLNGLGRILKNSPQNPFAHGIREGIALFNEILLECVRDDVRRSGCCLIGRHREGIGRIQNGGLRKEI